MSTDWTAAFAGVSPEMRGILDRALAGDEVSVDEAVVLDTATGAALHALCATADELRRRQAGDVVTYVVNRNVNFTNVCVKSCHFCAFARGLRSEQGYFLPLEEITRRVLEAQEMGATEVCVQAGLAPTDDGSLYINLCRAIKEAAPDLHIHAFSPEEVKYGAGLAKMPLREYLDELKSVGLGSLPGTSAEILDDRVRDLLAPGRLNTRQWIEIISTAHDLDIPTTSTIMFGHVETSRERMQHLDTLRTIQKETGGFTEFVPLSFVHTESPMYSHGLVEGCRPGPTGNEVIRLYAISRIMLGEHIPNLQASWVKEGPRMTQHLLSCGVNDVGGTLINESISTAAGAGHGQRMSPAMLRALIRGAGRAPAERSTLYSIRREFALMAGESEGVGEGLNAVEEDDTRFGSYDELAADQRYRYSFDEWQQKRRAVKAARRAGEAAE